MNPLTLSSILPLMAILGLSLPYGVVLAEQSYDTMPVNDRVRINLNTADAEALQYIPGIGYGKAREIIRVREESGGFKFMEELLAASGVGWETLAEINKYGTLDGGVSTLTKEMRANPPEQESTGND